MGKIIDDQQGSIKLLLDEKHEKILGAHIMGTNTAILIQEVVVAMNTENPVDLLRRTIHIHPALSEVVSKAINTI